MKRAISPSVATSKWSCLERLEDAAEIEEIRQMIHRHAQYTRSQRAFKILALVGGDGAQIRQSDAQGLQAHAAMPSSASNKPA